LEGKERFASHRQTVQQIKPPVETGGSSLRRGALLLLAALSGLLSALTGLLVRLLVLLIRLLLATALLTTTLAALLILLSALVWVVLGHSYFQFFESIACHHSTNLPKLSHIAANARDFKNKLDRGFEEFHLPKQWARRGFRKGGFPFTRR
jgi:hypothetical protein